jgi:hypothetical protein
LLKSKTLKVLAMAAVVAAPIAGMGATPAHAEDFSSPGIYLCKDANYVGCRYFPANSYGGYLDFGRADGNDNDTFSSIKIVGPYWVSLFSNTNYGGTAENFYFDDPNLADDGIGNDTASSMSIKSWPYLREGVALSTDAGYLGGTVLYSSSASTITYDNLISSLKISGRYKVTLYSEANYTGNSLTIDPSIGNPTDVFTLASYGFNDTVSSIKVETY